MKALIFIALSFCLISAKAQIFIADANAGYLLGVYNNNEFLIDTIASSMLNGNEQYEVYDLNGHLASVFGSTSETFPPCEETYYLSFDTLFENAVGCAIALRAPHNAYPSKIESFPVNNPSAIAIVKQWLSDSGFVNPEVKISQVIATDLDGDGIDEMLISATHYQDEYVSSANAGNYSIVLIQKIVDGKSLIIPVIYDLYIVETNYIAPMTYSIGGIIDVEGDGKYEFVIQWQYYEGAGVNLLRVNKNEVEFLLGSGCGV